MGEDTRPSIPKVDFFAFQARWENKALNYPSYADAFCWMFSVRQIAGPEVFKELKDAETEENVRKLLCKFFRFV